MKLMDRKQFGPYLIFVLESNGGGRAAFILDEKKMRPDITVADVINDGGEITRASLIEIVNSLTIKEKHERNFEECQGDNKEKLG